MKYEQLSFIKKIKVQKGSVNRGSLFILIIKKIKIKGLIYIFKGKSSLKTLIVDCLNKILK